MKSSRSRSRSKGNRNRSNAGGNVINRVFDSSGPEGKVRGTPQQIIDKYNQLARDAQLSNDRVAAENFQQHAEHYLRLLSEAQREVEARREEQERQNRERQAERDRDRAARQEQDSQPQSQPQSDPTQSPQPDVVVDTGIVDDDGDSGLVETPESQPKPKPKQARARTTRKPKAEKTDKTPDQPDNNAPEAAE